MEEVARDLQPGVLHRLFRNPIALRELRVAGRSWKIFIAFIISLALQVGVMAIVLSFSGTQEPATIGRWAFIAQSIIMLVSVVIVLPAFSCMAIVNERERNSFDLLLLTHLSVWEVVWGKLVSSMTNASLFLIASLPVYALCVSFGGVSTKATAFVLVALFILGLLISSLGIYCSVVFTKPIASLIVTYIAAIALGFLALLIGSAFMAALLYNSSEFSWLALLSRPGKEVAITILAISIVVVLYFIYFFLITLAKLKTASQDRSFAMRVFALIAVGVFTIFSLVAPLTLDSVPQSAAVVLAFVFPSLAVLPLIGLPIIASAGTALPPRVIARRFKRLELASPLKAFRWLLVPGSLSGFVLAMTLALIVAFAASVMFSRLTHNVADNSSFQDLRESSEVAFEIGTFLSSDTVGEGENARIVDVVVTEVVLQNLNAAAGNVSSTASTQTPQQLAAALGSSTTVVDIYRGMSSKLGNFTWRVLLYGFVFAFAWGALAWWLSHARRPLRVLPLILIVSLILISALPFIIRAAVPGLRGTDFYRISPIALWFDASLLMSFDQIRLFSMTRAQEDLIAEARGNAEMRVTLHLTIQIVIGVLGMLMALRARKRAIAMSQAADERWPVPSLPAPCQTMASRQTGLGGTAPVVAPPPPFLNPVAPLSDGSSPSSEPDHD